GWLELSPLSVLDLRAGVEPVAYFGTFHSLLSYRGYGDAFDDASRSSRRDAQAGLAGRAYIAPALKARFGRLVVRSRAELEWRRPGVRGPLFYEPGRDTLLRSSGDRLLAGESMLLWTFKDSGSRRLLAGPVHEILQVDAAPANRRQSLGILG